MIARASEMTDQRRVATETARQNEALRKADLDNREKALENSRRDRLLRRQEWWDSYRWFVWGGLLLVLGILILIAF